MNKNLTEAAGRGAHTKVMVSQNMNKPSQDLLTTLKGEVLGEALFRTAYYLCFAQERKKKMYILWKLEAQTKERILKYFGENNIEVPGLMLAAITGAGLGVLLTLTPWSQVIKAMPPVADKGLEIYRRLELQAPEEYKALFAYVVAHEVALKRFAEIEIEGNEQESLEPIEALLDD
mgnify:CR=1 FL=1